MYSNSLFENQVVLVTGGRSGIGFAIAKQYLQLGAKVIIASRKEEALKKARQELSKFGECKYKACDIRNIDDINSLVEFIKNSYQNLDILINNAGGQFPSLAKDISPNGWNAVINNNLNGTFYMSNAMANSFFIPQNNGTIVNIIAQIFKGFPSMAHTGAARAGVDNLTKTLGQEWAEYNIRVNAIAPGVIKSSGLDTYPKEMISFFDELEKTNLMKRLGTVEDISNAAMFLSSPLSSYISGITLYVDGLDHLANNNMKLYNHLKTFM